MMRRKGNFRPLRTSACVYTVACDPGEPTDPFFQKACFGVVSRGAFLERH